jgi:hypothetical protein
MARLMASSSVQAQYRGLSTSNHIRRKSMDNRSFVSVRIGLLMPEELRFIKEVPIEQRRDRTGIIPGGVVIARLEPTNRHSLRVLYEKMAEDGDMQDRYIMDFDSDKNRINVMFKGR